MYQKPEERREAVSGQHRLELRPVDARRIKVNLAHHREAGDVTKLGPISRKIFWNQMSKLSYFICYKLVGTSR